MHPRSHTVEQSQVIFTSSFPQTLPRFMLIFFNLGFSLQITDFVSPLCEVVHVAADKCPTDVSECGSHNWELTANLTDGNGTGIISVSLSQGKGNLTHTSLDAPVVQANYKASCCSPIVLFAAVDEAGNAGRCFYSIVGGASPAAYMFHSSCGSYKYFSI